MIELPIIDAAIANEGSSSPRFWRSLGQLQQDPEFQKRAQHEFLPGASDGPGNSSRRRFIQLMGASMALAGLTGCRKPIEKILPFSHKPEEMIPGIPLRYATSMPFRGAMRGLLVTSHDGRPTKIEGNPEHPDAHGATGIFEQASILNLYDPDRSGYALRDGNKATWSDFMSFCRTFAGDASKRVAVLVSASSSMTMAAQRRALAKAYPRLRWVTYEADPVTDGMRLAFGRVVRPRYNFENARVIVSLDADFLGLTDRDMVHNTRSFAAGRRLESPKDDMSRLYVAESDFSITGSMADHRLRLRSSDVPAFAAALAARLGISGFAGNAFADHPFVVEMARDLQAAAGKGVVLAGETQSPAVHALCAAINGHLGGIGKTMHLLDAGDDGGDGSLAELVADMRGGNVDALLMLGCNPVYDAPADLDFGVALKRVEESIHVGLHVDETARDSRWHIPAAHYLEAWGDGRSYNGTQSVVQPLIAPLYDDAHSEIEVISALGSGKDTPGYDLVRAQWKKILSGDFEKNWKRVLHDGFLPKSGFDTVSARATAPAGFDAASPAPDTIEVVFRLDPKVLDGRFANNAWMQELPAPTTKVTWDNVAMMSPATAEELGVHVALRNGKDFCDQVKITVSDRSVVLPVWIQPGMADHSIALSRGYGRDITSRREEMESNLFDRDAYVDVYGHGSIANGVGVNVAGIRVSDALQVLSGAKVEKVEGEYLIATTQDHGTLPDEMEQVRLRNPFVATTMEDYRTHPNFVEEEEHLIREPWETYPTLWESSHPTKQAAYKDNPYFKNQWGMVIDLQTCTGCNACVVACQAENNIQVVGKEEVSNGREMQWIRLDRYFVSETDDVHDPQMVLQPVPCMHCENAPCEEVCPVAATVHSPDGTNQMIYNRCIGTRYCANNCPYKVRRFNFYNWTKDLPTQVRMTQNPNVTVRSRGVMEKCSYCIQRIRAVDKQVNIEKRTIQDGEIKTACQQVCPAQAITFGDLNDANSKVSEVRENDRRYELLAELGIKPRTSYLARVRNPNPRLSAEA